MIEEILFPKVLRSAAIRDETFTIERFFNPIQASTSVDTVNFVHFCQQVAGKAMKIYENDVVHSSFEEPHSQLCKN